MALFRCLGEIELTHHFEGGRSAYRGSFDVGSHARVLPRRGSRHSLKNQRLCTRQKYSGGSVLMNFLAVLEPAELVSCGISFDVALEVNVVALVYVVRPKRRPEPYCHDGDVCEHVTYSIKHDSNEIRNFYTHSPLQQNVIVSTMIIFAIIICVYCSTYEICINAPSGCHIL